jgi:hypothetical protein
MQKKITLNLDEKVYQRLLAHCQGDENALQEYVAKILETHKPDSEQGAAGDINKGLEDYLKKGSTGTRSYGIKGQGW